MTDSSPTTPADHVSTLMTEAQMENSVASRILSEVQTGFSYSSPNEDTGAFYLSRAQDDMDRLTGDPAKAGILQVMAAKIESHDPTLAPVQAKIERNEKGEITGFTFADERLESSYNDKLNADMQQGNTLTQAQGFETDKLSASQLQFKQGVMHMDATDVPPPIPQR
jgi:hypothetical protein